VEQNSGIFIIVCSPGLEFCDHVSLSRDINTDRGLVIDGFDERVIVLNLLLFGREGPLSSVTEHDETLDTLDGDEPRSDALDHLKVIEPSSLGMGWCWRQWVVWLDATMITRQAV